MMLKSVFRSTRLNAGIVILTVMMVVVILAAGCSSQKQESAAPAGGAPPGAASGAPAGTAAPAASGSCFTLNGKGAWDGKWKGQIGGSQGRGTDLRSCFYPATKENPDPWEDCPSHVTVDMELSQTGCDVNGKMTVTSSAVKDCPVTMTGKAEGTSVRGTWKAYCDLGTPVNGITDESGSFSLWIDPTGVSFIGAFDGSSPAAVVEMNSAVAEGLNSNFAGKRV